MFETIGKLTLSLNVITLCLNETVMTLFLNENENSPAAPGFLSHASNA